MKITILGATRHVTKDLIRSMCRDEGGELYIEARRPSDIEVPPGQTIGQNRFIEDYARFGSITKFDALIYFVAVDNPAAVVQIAVSDAPIPSAQKIALRSHTSWSLSKTPSSMPICCASPQAICPGHA